MAGKVKHAKPLKDYAKQHGVSLRTMKRRSAAGLPVGDDDLGEAIPPANARPEDYKNLSVDEVKRRTGVVKWLKEARQLATLDREYLPTHQVREDCIGVGAVFDAELSALLNDLPGLLAGLSEADVRAKLAPRIAVLKSSVKKRLTNVAG